MPIKQNTSLHISHIRSNGTLQPSSPSCAAPLTPLQIGATFSIGHSFVADPSSIPSNMLSTRAFTAIAALFALFITKTAAGDVYAHFILGNAGSYVQSDWAKDIALAANSKIDGFALNIGGDSYTDTQLGYAYAAAEAHGNFKLFISFDYGANPGFSASGVTSTINKYKGSSAQAQYLGKPLVSTFEGPSAAGDWPGIKSNTGCFFVPDWTSAKGTPSTFNVADGALSWDIWPTTAADMTDANDKAWQSLLGSKVYMMGISPWFYTNLPAYHKNWLWRGNGLWYNRWQQALEIKPELIEIVTWNDFGESHYIGPIVPSEVVPGAGGYVDNNPHDGWRALLPYYIEAYKNGNQPITPTEDILSWAHQPNPVKACGTGGTTGGQNGGDPTQYAEDLIDVDVALTAPADISVTIGGGPATTKSAVSAGISHFQVPFNGQTGQVVYTVSRNGATVMTVQGTQISSDCTTVNWNAVTGSQTAPSSPSTSTCTVNFVAKDTTVYGENIFIAGDNAALGNWATDKALALNANQYTADNPLWEGSVSLPAGSTVTYRYFKKGTDGSTITWQGANRTLTVPGSCAGVVTQSDDVDSTASSTCTVNFIAKDTTVFGENIFIAGDDAALGNWATDKALALNADQYTADNPIWVGSVNLPAGSTVTYKYFKKGTDGSTITWQGTNRALTVPGTCAGVVTQRDSVA